MIIISTTFPPYFNASILAIFCLGLPYGVANPPQGRALPKCPPSLNLSLYIYLI